MALGDSDEPYGSHCPHEVAILVLETDFSVLFHPQSSTQPGLELFSFSGIMYVAPVELHALDFSQARMLKEEEDKKAGLRPGQVHPADFEDELPFVVSFFQISKVFFIWGFKTRENLYQPGNNQSPHLTGINQTS